MRKYLFDCLGSVVVSVMDSHPYDRGSNPGQGTQIKIIRYALNNIQISDESSADLVLYLCE